MEQIDYEALGKQLRCPSGEYAQAVGENMFDSNAHMIARTIDSLSLKPAHRILEVGFGNGKHIPYLLSRAPGLFYQGLDISKAMVEEAQSFNREKVESGFASFTQVSGTPSFPFVNDYFHACLSVNTIYFWDKVQAHLNEIARVLRPGGMLALGYIEKAFGESLPFTQKGFQFYETDVLEDLLRKAGFQSIKVLMETESTTRKDGIQAVRPFFVCSALKPFSP